MDITDVLFFLVVIYVIWKFYKSEGFGDGLSYNGIMWGEKYSPYERNEVKPKQVSSNSLPPNPPEVKNTVDYGIRRQFASVDDALTNMEMNRNKSRRDAHLNRKKISLRLAKDLFEDELAKNENRDWFTNWDDNSLVRPGETIPVPYTPYSLKRS
jgi:hypothetical protein